MKKQLYNIVKKEFGAEIQSLTDRVYMLECIVKECLPAEMMTFNLDQKKEGESLSDINMIEKHIPIPDYESTLLGGLLLDNNKMALIAERVSACHFATKRHQDIFSAMIKLKMSKQPIDTISVLDKLKKLNQADPNMEIYLFDLAKEVPAEAIPHLPSIANIVMMDSYQRSKK